MNERAKTAILIAAAVLIGAALILGLDVRRDDPLSAVADEINAFGYSLASDDFYVLGGATDTTIASLIAETESDITPVLDASAACGFKNGVDEKGDITVLLAQVDKGVLTLYLRDGVIEVAFIQTSDGEILSLS